MGQQFPFNHFFDQDKQQQEVMPPDLPLINQERSEDEKAVDAVLPTTETEKRTPPPSKPDKSGMVKDARFTIDLMPSEKDLMDRVDATVINHFEGPKFGHILDPMKTFESFIVGPASNIAYASTQSMAQAPGKLYPFLYIYGGPGLGKTHLLHAAGNKIQELFPKNRVYITTGGDFKTELVNSVANRQGHIFRRKYCEKIDSLLIDDIHEVGHLPGTQKELFHIFDELSNRNKQIFVTADRPPHEIKGLDPRLSTRLASALVFDVKSPDAETRLSIVKRKASEEDIFLPNDVLAYIATNIRGSIRELEGALVRLGAYSSVMKIDIDLETARTQLRQIEGRHAEGRLTVEKILDAVSSYFRIPVVDIISPVRHKRITKARHISAYLCHKHLSLTFGQIGTHFGGRDHTTILYAVDKMKKELHSDLELGQLISTVEKDLLL